MKRAFIGLVVLAASSCASTPNRIVMEIKPLHERVIEDYVKECDNLTSNGIYITPFGYGISPSEIARVGKVLEDKTDCHLSVYEDTFNKSIWSREFVVQKNDSTYDMGSFQPPRYKKLYPSHK